MTTTLDHTIRTVDQLRDVIGEPGDAVRVKLGDTLDEHARDFLADCPFVVLGTVGADGTADASPKGDPAGFILVEDDHSLVIPDRPGNNLAFGLTNIVETGRVGLLCIVPGTTETLRINGRAELTRDPELLERMSVQGKPALLGIRVHVEEVFFHCAKAFIRSQLWKHEEWLPKKKVSFGRMLAPKVAPDDDGSLAELIDESIEENYRTGLY